MNNLRDYVKQRACVKHGICVSFQVDFLKVVFFSLK
jgi:hypothetical protein